MDAPPAGTCHLEIVYASLPDSSGDRSAAMEFSQRAAAAASSRQGRSASIRPLRENDVAEWGREEKPSGDDFNHSVTLYVVSCGPDGSVDRLVRKLARKIKDDAASLTKPTTKADGDADDFYRSSLALLGHSVCKTSAEQMHEQVFATGRRLAKVLRQARGCPVVETLETQVELVAPEESFDPWIQRLCDTLDEGTTR